MMHNTLLYKPNEPWQGKEKKVERNQREMKTFKIWGLVDISCSSPTTFHFRLIIAI